MSQQSQAILSSQHSKNTGDNKAEKNTIKSSTAKKSLNIQFSNKLISADLAHLSEPESPPPNRKIDKNSFRLDNAKDSSKVLLDLENHFGGTSPQVNENDLVLLQQMPQPIVNAQ